MDSARKEAQVAEASELQQLGYRPELRRNRSTLTLLCQSLAIAAIPYGEGAPLLSAIVGGGPRSIFVGWILVCLLDQCVAMSLGELASRYPTSAGPYYWSFQVATRGKILLSYFTGWSWLAGNLFITLSVNFGFAQFLAATIRLYNEDWTGNSWEILLMFFAICTFTFICCAAGNRILPAVDTACAIFTVATIIAVLIALPMEARTGKHDAAYALGHYETTFSGYGNFTFFIGLLPAAYTFSALGMISAMAEEVEEPTVQVPRALSLCVPIGGLAGLFFILPICFTLPAMEDLVSAPNGQVLPFLFAKVMSNTAGAVSLCCLVLTVTLFCSISITNAASRCTWAFARDKAIPLSSFWAHINRSFQIPMRALFLVTIAQMILGLIYLGNSTAFTAFISMGVIALAVSYAVPIIVSMLHARRQVHGARWNFGRFGWVFNVVAVVWIAFEVVLFSMPFTLPTNAASMNYAAAVWIGSGIVALGWYLCHARNAYRGPPESDGL